VLGLQWLDDDQATLKLGTEHIFTLVDGTIVETQVMVRRPEHMLMTSTKAHKLMRKSARAKGRTADFSTIHLKVVDQRLSSECHLGDKLSDQHGED
jgi:hypothetical protein